MRKDCLEILSSQIKFYGLSPRKVHAWLQLALERTVAMV